MGGVALGKWVYGAVPQFAYGCDTTYRLAADYLDGPHIVEDWGCGTAYARRFFKQARYIGIDGSWSLHCDTVADLRTYKGTQAGGILLRHVLEHNVDWAVVLANAVACAQKRLAVVLFTPLVVTTLQIAWNVQQGVPDLAFCTADITAAFKGLRYTAWAGKTDTQYGAEHIFYVEK